MIRRALLLSLLVGSACGPTPTRHYYTLTSANPATRFDEPFPLKLRVRDLEMRRSYRRDELVFRSDAHELTFQRSRRWSEPPQRMISGLLREHVRRSNIATEVQDDAAVAEPDFVLGGDIEAIEQLNVDSDRYAHVAIVLRLTRFKDDATVWTYKIDARRPVTGASARATVRVMSEIIAEEGDLALADLGAYFENPDAPRAAPAATAKPEAADVLAPPESAVVGPEDARLFADVPQLARDDTPVAPGLGSIFAPTLTDGEREPLVSVYQNGSPVAEGQLGKRIPVPPGEYEVRVGSGTVSQQLTTRARVVEGKTTIIPPSWAGLDVAVVDESFLPFRGTYELISMAQREDFGLGFGADEQLGEETRVWVLRPGLYKLIRAGGTYRDRTNFATVRLEAGKLTRFTLVLDPDDGSFRGAGENDPDLTDLRGTDEDAEKRWILRAVIGGDLNFNRSQEVGAQRGWKLSFHVFFDGSTRLSTGPHLWTSRLELEEGQTRLLDKQTFQNDTDRLFLHTIYIYQLWSWFGPYARVGLETKLLPRHEDFDEPRDVVEVDEAGNVVRMFEDVSRVRLGGTFSPLQLKQGVGGNFRLLRNRFADLDLRLGFGARQTLVSELFVFEDATSTQPARLIPVVDSTVEGLEGTVVLLARPVTFATLSSEFDGLVPIGDDSIVFTWRNQLSLRLVSFISLNYRFNVTRDPNLGIGTELRTEHDVQLRFSYVLF